MKRKELTCKGSSMVCDHLVLFLCKRTFLFIFLFFFKLEGINDCH